MSIDSEQHVTLDLKEFEFTIIDKVPIPMKEFFQNLKIIEKAKESEICCFFYDQTLLKLSYQPQQLEGNLKFISTFSKEIRLARKLVYCLQLDFEKLLSQITSIELDNDYYIQKLFLEQLYVKVTEWDEVIISQYYSQNFQPSKFNQSNPIQKIENNIKEILLTKKLLIELQMFKEEKQNITFNSIFFQHNDNISILLENLLNFSYQVRVRCENKLNISIDSKKYFEYLRNFYLFQNIEKREQESETGSLYKNWIHSNILKEYENIQRIIQKLIQLQSISIHLHWDMLKLDKKQNSLKRNLKIQLKMKEIGQLLWSILDGLFRAFHDIWTKTFESEDRTINIMNIADEHENYLNQINSFFEDKNIERILISVENLIELLNNMKEDELEIRDGIQVYDACSHFFRQRCLNDERLGQYLFLPM